MNNNEFEKNLINDLSTKKIKEIRDISDNVYLRTRTVNNHITIIIFLIFGILGMYYCIDKNLVLYERLLVGGFLFVLGTFISSVINSEYILKKITNIKLSKNKQIKELTDTLLEKIHPNNNEKYPSLLNKMIKKNDFLSICVELNKLDIMYSVPPEMYISIDTKH